MKRLLLIAVLLAMIVCPVLAAEFDENYTVTGQIDTTPVNSPYIDAGLWFYITSIGFIALGLSYLPRKYGGSLWAMISPLFLFASARFASMLQYTITSTYFEAATGTGVNAELDEWHLLLDYVVYHVDWLAIVMGIIFLLSFINMWYILSRKTIEKPSRRNNYDTQQEED